jgi:hypothetical protein
VCHTEDPQTLMYKNAVVCDLCTSGLTYWWKPRKYTTVWVLGPWAPDYERQPRDHGLAVAYTCSNVDKLRPTRPQVWVTRTRHIRAVRRILFSAFWVWNGFCTVLHAKPSTQLPRGNRSSEPQGSRTDACLLLWLKMSRRLLGSRVCVCALGEDANHAGRRI